MSARSTEHSDRPSYSGLMSEVALALLGEPTSMHHGGRELRYGTHGLLSIGLQKNVYYDHEAGQGGGNRSNRARARRRLQRCGEMARCQRHSDHVEREEKWSILQSSRGLRAWLTFSMYLPSCSSSEH